MKDARLLVIGRLIEQLRQPLREIIAILRESFQRAVKPSMLIIRYITGRTGSPFQFGQLESPVDHLASYIGDPIRNRQRKYIEVRPRFFNRGERSKPYSVQIKRSFLVLRERRIQYHQLGPEVLGVAYHLERGETGPEINPALTALGISPIDLAIESHLCHCGNVSECCRGQRDRRRNNRGQQGLPSLDLVKVDRSRETKPGCKHDAKHQRGNRRQAGQARGWHAPTVASGMEIVEGRLAT
jgi:hypothetical protein